MVNPIKGPCSIVDALATTCTCCDVTSDRCLVQHGLERVLAEFWRPRQNLELPQPERPASAPTSHVVNARGAVISRATPDHAHLPRSKSGLVAGIDGVLRGTNLGALSQGMSVPIVLITSTRDALDSSKTAEVSQCSLQVEPMTWIPFTRNTIYQVSTSLY